MNVNFVMFKSNGQRKDIPISNPLTVIGRGADCGLRIPLSSVSRRQCEVSLAGQQLKVKDLGSSNGTYVNNKRVNEATLKAGDRLLVGPVVFTVQVNGKPDEIKPVEASPEQKKEEEEVVDLEADLISGGNDSSGSSSGSDIALEMQEEEVDPIAALEALADEGDKKKKKA